MKNSTSENRRKSSRNFESSSINRKLSEQIFYRNRSLGALIEVYARMLQGRLLLSILTDNTNISLLSSEAGGGIFIRYIHCE